MLLREMNLSFKNAYIPCEMANVFAKTEMVVTITLHVDLNWVFDYIKLKYQTTCSNYSTILKQLQIKTKRHHILHA